MLHKDQVYTLPSKQVALCGNALSKKIPRQWAWHIHIDKEYIVATNVYYIVFCPLDQAKWPEDTKVNIPENLLVRFSQPFITKCKKTVGVVYLSDYDVNTNSFKIRLVDEKGREFLDQAETCQAHYPDWKSAISDLESMTIPEGIRVKRTDLAKSFLVDDEDEWISEIGMNASSSMSALINNNVGAILDKPYAYVTLKGIEENPKFYQKLCDYTNNEIQKIAKLHKKELKEKDA